MGRDDIGSCAFPVQSPPFVPGAGDCAIRAAGVISNPDCNLVNAADGRGASTTIVLAGDNLADVDDIPILELDGLVQAEFSSAHRILIHLAHYPPGRLSAVELAGRPVAFPELQRWGGRYFVFYHCRPAGFADGTPGFAGSDNSAG